MMIASATHRDLSGHWQTLPSQVHVPPSPVSTPALTRTRAAISPGWRPEIVELDHEPTQACEVGPTLTNYRNITGCHCDERASRCRRGEQRPPECISDFRQDFCNPDRLMCGAPQRFIGSLAQLRIRLRVPNGHSCLRPQKAVEITPSLRNAENLKRQIGLLRR